MARVQLVIPDEHRDRFLYQARKEGVTLSAWLRAAAHERLSRTQRTDPFESTQDVEEFFRECDALERDQKEPDWSEHRAVMSEAQPSG